eukprot:g64807.t1
MPADDSIQENVLSGKSIQKRQESVDATGLFIEENLSGSSIQGRQEHVGLRSRRQEAELVGATKLDADSVVSPKYPKAAVCVGWSVRYRLLLRGMISMCLWITSQLAVTFLPTSGLCSLYGLGLIWTASPLGNVLGSLAMGSAVARYGALSAPLFGLGLVAFGLVAFACVPMLDLGTTGLLTSWLLFAFMTGAGAGFAQSALFPILAQALPGHIGTLLSLSEVIAGLGLAVGPLVGGILFDAGSSLSAQVQFALPFLVMAAVIVLLSVAPAESATSAVPVAEASQIAAPNLRSILYARPEILSMLIMIATATFVWSAVESILPLKLETEPFHASTTEVGLAYMVASLGYFLPSIPLGYLLDRYPNPGMFRFLTYTGAWLLVVSLWLLVPAPWSQHVLLNKLFSFRGVALPLVLIGAGNSFILLTSLVAMLAKFPKPHTESLQAALNSSWMIAVQVGEMLGSLLGTFLVALTEDRARVCVQDGNPGFCFGGAMTVISFICLASLALSTWRSLFILPGREVALA